MELSASRKVLGVVARARGEHREVAGNLETEIAEATQHRLDDGLVAVEQQRGHLGQTRRELVVRAFRRTSGEGRRDDVRSGCRDATPHARDRR